MSAVDNLIKQILASSNTSKWSGEGFGSAEKNAADMAKILSKAGITDIKQLGVKQEVIPAMYGEGLNEPERVVNKYYNKATGQELENTYGERQTGNFFGGTFTGKGNTGYGVQFKPDGTPVFYTQGASSNDLAQIMQMAGPVGQIGLAIATGGLSIPQQIAARFAMNVLSGQDVGDAVKGAAISYAMANIPGTDVMKESSKFLNKLDDSGVLSSAFKNATMSGARALVMGQDVGKAMLTGAATGGVNGALNALMDTDEFKGLTSGLSAAQKKLVVNAATGVMSGKPLDQIIINSAMSAARDAALKAQTENQVIDPYFKNLGSKTDSSTSLTRSLGNNDLDTLIDSITKTTDSSGRTLSNQEILDMIGYTGDTEKEFPISEDGVVTVRGQKDLDTASLEDILSPYKKVTPETLTNDGKVIVTGKRETDTENLDFDPTRSLTPTKITDMGTEVITAKRLPPREELDLSVDQLKLDVPDLKLDDILADITKTDDKAKVTTPAKVTVPTKVTTPTPTPDTFTYVPTGAAPPPSQDPYAKVKFMEDLFGPELSNQFLTDVSMQTPKTNDIEALLRVLRG
jgi:hypothetical protein